MQGWALLTAASVLAVLMMSTALSLILTVLAFHRFDQMVAYPKAQRDSTPLPTIDTPFGRLIGRLVPDVVMINTFPRMSHIVEYMELTGERRRLIVAVCSSARPRTGTCGTGRPWPAPRPPKASPAD